MPEDHSKTTLIRVRQALGRGRPQRIEQATRHAAVAAVLRQQGPETDVLLIQRTTREGDPWSGHVAFPGGRAEPDDRDLQHTAERETLEEIGLDLNAHAKLLGTLDDVPVFGRGLAPQGMIIRPFVYELTDLTAVVNSSDEVLHAFWVPLGPMFREETATTIEYPYGGTSYRFPGYEVRHEQSEDGLVVWGLTYRMLQTVFDLLRLDR